MIFNTNLIPVNLVPRLKWFVMVLMYNFEKSKEASHGPFRNMASKCKQLDVFIFQDRHTIFMQWKQFQNNGTNGQFSLDKIVKNNNYLLRSIFGNSFLKR